MKVSQAPSKNKYQSMLKGTLQEQKESLLSQEADLEMQNLS